ncbi:hypothetical protein OHC33_009936 [Knufia fluminis]|uniref:Oxidoreductase n=1 Tax=Knufia fluminis TaxID=191047 RepID=A0AAN8EA58_9EURO|nr:hypothetical protein OHC33_009936 [Knufia fluminis]
MAPFPSPTKKWHDTTYPSLSPTRPELSAKGKTILITGGGTGIGAATAHSFAAAGASRIALLGRRPQPLHDTKTSILQTYSSVSVSVYPTDVTNQSEVDTAFSDFLANTENNKIDILVSNAATIGPRDPIATVNAPAFLASIQQNLAGSLHIAQAFLRHAAPNATAISINSSAAHLNFAPLFAAYSVAKLAVFRLWDSFAFGSPDVSVFHVQPGVVDTDMNKEAGGVEAIGFSDDATFNVWLASPEARFLKGKFLWANWDVDELKANAKDLEASTKLNVGLVGWPFQDAAWDFKPKVGNW